MLDLLKKHGIPAGIAAAIVLAITLIPIVYQYKYTVAQNRKIAELEATVQDHEEIIVSLLDKYESLVKPIK